MDIKIGSTFRQCFADGSASAFSDAMVVRIYVVNGETYCDMMRPFVCSETLSLDEENIDRVSIKNLGTPFWQEVKR